MLSQRALSNIDSAYNDLRDNQKSSNLEFYNHNSFKHSALKTATNGKRNFVDTKTYLAQIESRLDRKNKRRNDSRSSSSSSYESPEENQRQPSTDGRVTKISHNKVREQDMPSKFKKMDQSKLSQINFRADFNHPIGKNYQDQSIMSMQQQQQFGQYPQQQQQQQQQFLIPQNLSLSKGPSEIQSNSPPKGQFPNMILDLHQKYVQSPHPSLHPQSQLMQQPPKLVESRVSYQTQDQKARFFQIAVDIKNQYPPNHPVQNVLIAKLYSECKSYQIPEDQWPNWIQQYLQQI